MGESVIKLTRLRQKLNLNKNKQNMNWQYLLTLKLDTPNSIRVDAN